MKRAKSVICTIMMMFVMFVLSACAGRTSNDSAVSMSGQEESKEESKEGSKEEVEVMDELCLSVGDIWFS